MIWHPLHTDLPRPSAFNNPFSYDPDPLCRLAAEEVKAYVRAQTDWQAEVEAGKMFGVLVCEDAKGQLGFLAAYSGQIQGREDHLWFVPAVFDYLQPDGYFKQEEARISAINHRIAALESASNYVSAKQHLSALHTQSAQEIASHKAMMREAKARRDAERASAPTLPPPSTIHHQPSTLTHLERESQFQKAELHRLKKSWQERIAEAEATVKAKEEQITLLKHARKQRSDALQRWLFDHFEMLNQQGERRTLTDIFRLSLTPPSTIHHQPSTIHHPQQLPPSGSGECCAPKLLQYAFLHQLKPLCIAEFWQGRSPKMEIRHHDRYYPACRGKCRPILGWMLSAHAGSVCGGSPAASHSANMPDAAHTPLPRVLFADSSLLVLSKPAGLLSVPGKTDARSVESILRETYPEVHIVHRLDQDTSGLMVVALTTDAYHHLQRQFLQRTIYKRYIALLDGILAPPSTINHQPSTLHHQPSTITLPLRPDLDDRPRQLVDHEHGKPAITDYEILSVADGHTRVALTPHTGRTHQLRMHCAHHEGLNCPILGDRLYGHSSPLAPPSTLLHPPSRLYLHAETLSFNHPVTGERLTFTDPAPF